MSFIAGILGVPLGYVMVGCYMLTGNYGGSIVLFSLLTKILFWPLSVSSQKNAIRLLKLQPQIAEIKQRYAGGNDQINEKIVELYQREHYSALKSMAPLLIQLALVLGMINVIYNPLTHLLHLPAGTTEQVLAATRALFETDNLGAAGQLLAVRAIQEPANRQAFAFLGAAGDPARGLSLRFLGLDLGLTPGFSAPAVLFLIPLLSGVSSLTLCLVQNRLSPA